MSNATCPPCSFSYGSVFTVPIYFRDASNQPSDPFSVKYTLYWLDSCGTFRQAGPDLSVAVKGGVGYYYANGIAGQCGGEGCWRIRWTYQESFDGPVSTIDSYFQVSSACGCPAKTCTSCLCSSFRACFMPVSFQRGQQLSRSDLNIFLTNASGHPTNAYEIYYAIFQFVNGSEVLIGESQRIPQNPEVGEYYAPICIPNDANVGEYRIRWYFRQAVGKPLNTIVQEFQITGAASPSFLLPEVSEVTSDLVRRLRILLRDSWPDKHAHFRPPTHEDTINGFNKVFGYLWEDYELVEFLERSLDMIAASPPRTPFNSLDDLVRQRREWRTLLLTGAMQYALMAMMIHWVGEQFSYSIGGISLDINKSSEYASAKENAEQQFTEQLERAKQTVKIFKGLRQSRYGMGIRSAFGPAAGRGSLSPAKFIGLLSRHSGFFVGIALFFSR